MRWFRNIFLLSFPAIFLIFNTGCSSLGRYQTSRYREAPAGQLLFDPAPRFQDPTYFSKWSGEVSEHDKIGYLLDRVARSSDHFIRNGETHDGQAAREWFLYKMNHWVKGGVGTAEDFITRVASYSQKTGNLYLVELQDGERYTLRSVLRNELHAFESHLAEFKTLTQGTMAQPAQVRALPHTPPAVAATNG